MSSSAYSSLVYQAQLDEDTIALAHQLQAFYNTGHKFIDVFGQETLKGIVTTCKRYPPTYPSVEEPTTRRGRSASVEELPYKQAWAIDKAELKKDLNRLRQGIIKAGERSLAEPDDTTLDPPNGPSDTSEDPVTLVTTRSPRKGKAKAVERPAIDRATSEYSNPRGISESASHPTTSTRPTTAYSGKTEEIPAMTNQGGFTDAQRHELSQLIAQTVAETIRALPSQIGQAGPAGPAGPAGAEGLPGPAGTAGTGSSEPKWNASEVGIFHPDMDDSLGKGPIVHSSRETYFRDVHLFCERIKDIAKIHGPDYIRQNVWQCLRGSALEWYTAILTDMEKRLLATGGNDVSEWCNALVNRFAETPADAMKAVLKERYTLEDARNHRDPRSYAQSMIRNAKSAKLDNVYNQLTLVYGGFDVEFRRDLTVPTTTTTLDGFLQQLDVYKNIWFEMASRSYRDGSNNGKPSTNPSYRGRDGRPARGNRGYGDRNYNNRGYNDRGYNNRGYDRGYNQPPYNNNYQNGAYPQQQQNERPSNDQRAITVPARLQITAAGQPNASGSNSPANQNQQNRRPYQGPTNRGQSWGNNRWQGRPQGAYQADDHYPDNVEQGSYDGYDEHDGYNGYDGYNEAGYNAGEVHENSPHQEDRPPDNPGEPSDNRSEPTVDALFTTSSELNEAFICNRCQDTFTSNNRLHNHLRQCRPAKLKPPREPLLVNFSDETTVIVSTAPSESKPGFGFRSWRYAMMATAFNVLAKMTYDLCLDTGCTMSLIDRAFFAEVLPNCPITRYDQGIPVRGIGNDIHNCKEYAEFDLYVPTANGKLAKIHRGARIVDNLKAKMLIGMDILGPEGFTIDLPRRLVTITSCQDVEIPISIQSSTYNRVDRVVRSARLISVPAHSTTMIPIKLRGKSSLPEGRDYLFEPVKYRLGTEGGFLAHIIDSKSTFIEARNTTDLPVVIPRHARLGRAQEYEAEGCYHTSLDSSLATGPVSWFKQAITAGTMALLASTTDSSTSNARSDLASLSHGSTFPKSMEFTSPGGLTVYGDPDTQRQLLRVAESYPTIWNASGPTVDIPEKDWMTIPLLPNVKLDAAKVYPLGQRDREVVDKEFDQMHVESRMSWTDRPTPHGYPVFVVWKTVRPSGKPPERKGRVVTDIRGLNKKAETDAYPMPLQTDITSAVKDSPFISTMDATSFFHQWPVKTEHRHRITVVSHRGQEQYNVAPMGYKNSPPYVQRQVDGILRPYREFSRAYIDDIVVYSRTLEEHLRHLTTIFSLFDKLRIRLKASKSYLGYPNVVLLGQRVDAFGLTTVAEKLKAITQLAFPRTLRDLETYLGMTGWLRNYIQSYAQKVAPLQARKTMLLRGAPGTGKQRQTYCRATLLQPTNDELDAFISVQESFANPRFLVHFDYNRHFFIDLDSSHAYGVGTMAYHVKNYDPSTAGYPARDDIEPVLFLSKMLNQAESHYWPTELEVAGLVWTIRRLRHLIEASKHPVIVYTDHSATTSIAYQTTLKSSNIDKLNTRLIRASQYLSQFSLDIRHKPGKTHYVPDALSRLPVVGQKIPNESEEGTLDIHAYYLSLIEMTDDFKARIKQGYTDDKNWSSILDMLRKENKTLAPPATSFYMEDDLIYHKDITDRPRLCLPSSFEKEVFELAHDNNSHIGFHRAYQRIAETLYLHRLSRRLRLYIAKCHACQQNQIKRHRPYGSLVPITPPPIPFHTIAMDFVLALPENDGLDTLLTVTDKFTKRVLLIAGKITWMAKDWAIALINGLQQSDWGIPRGIISDRDPRFMSDLWKTMFTRLGTSMLTSTAYHPQTDGQSERTNQTVEVALRYLCTDPRAKLRWVAALPSIQATLNNSTNQSTGRSPTELMYGFKTREAINFLDQTVEAPYEYERDVVRQEAVDAVAFANAKAKIQYDSRHKPLLLNEGDQVYLRLHHGYSLQAHKESKANNKLSEQRVGPFKVISKIGQHAYKLDIPSHWRIHPVVSIAQLEPASLPTNDPWNRTVPNDPPPVSTEGDTTEWKSYEIERLVGDRVRNYGGKRIKEYLVRWKGYGPWHDRWYGEDLLTDAPNLVADYNKESPPVSSTSLVPYTGTRPTPPPVTTTVANTIAKRGRGRPRKNPKQRGRR